MFTNYFKTALRILRKNKLYSLVNIFGLAIGIVSTSLILLWVEDEVNYDTFHEHRDRLYAVRENQQYDKYVYTHWSTPAPMAAAIQTEIPGIAKVCRSTEGETPALINIGDKTLYASGKYADSSWFSLFTFPFLQGDPKNPFPQLYSIVITERTAKKFFGSDENVIGKTVRLDKKQDYIVSGVIKDIPANSTLQFDWIIPFEIFYQQNQFLHAWGNNTIVTYVELNPSTNPASVDNILHDYIQKREPSSISHLFLFSMKDWHLRDEFTNGKQTGGGRIEFVRLFTVIAVIILLIACINFMNLATSGSEKRTKEIGIRKVLGGSQKSLILQFIGEAVFMALLAMVLALVVMLLVRPSFNSLVQKDLSLGLGNPMHLTALLLITLLCGLIAGSYPSLYLSSLNPAFVLKGIKIKTGSAPIIRKTLVVLQFSASIIFIICTIIIYQQMVHIKTRHLGFNKNGLIEVSAHGDLGNNFYSIRRDLLNTGVVENAALSDHITLYGGNNTDRLGWSGKTPGSKVLVSGRNVSPEFFATSGMKLIEGRDLRSSDTMYKDGSVRKLNFVITESMAKIMGNGSALGKTVYNEGDSSVKLIVAGVVNDYVYDNMYGKPDPVGFFLLSPQNAYVMYARIKPESNIEEAMAKIEAVMKKDNPSYPFEYKFVDDEFNQMFGKETLISKLSHIFASLAIIISCLGLLGLAAFTAERRKKEISIRKVIGASTSGLVALLSREFIQLVIIACLIAFPVAWWTMRNWLEGYAYRIEISWWVFLVSGVLAILIAMIIVSYQAIKVAMASPIKSLKAD